MSQYIKKMRFSEKKTIVKAITSEEFVDLINNTPKKDKEARVSFLLAYGAGLRLSEVLNLNKENIKDKFIQIWEGKGGKDRTVPLPKGWKQWMNDILPIKKSGRSLQRNFKKYSSKAGLNPKYTFHSLRHGFAVRLVERGVPLNQVQMLMGHSNLSTTNVYTRARPMDAIKSYEELF